MLPFDLNGGESGHVNWHDIIHFLLRGSVPVKVTDPTNATPAILAAMDEAEPGGAVVFPPIQMATDPFVVQKGLLLVGMGPFFSRLVPRSNTTSPLVTFDTTVDSGGGIYGNYNPVLTGIGINRQGHMAGPCLHLTANARWMEVARVLCSGGTRSIEHHAPNATFENVKLWDPSDCMIDMDENGLELHLRHVVMSANVQSLDRFIRLTILSGGGLKGALYYDDLTGNTAGGGITVHTGLSIIAPSLTEVPVIANGSMVLDNVNGGGPVIDLKNVQTIGLRGWANGTNGCVRMDGCVGVEVDMRTRGGTHTFEWVGAKSSGFRSRSEVFTGPAYKVSTATKPDELDVDDWVAGATDIGQVTNDVEWLRGASRRKWGSINLQDRLYLTRPPRVAYPMGFEGDMVGGSVTLPAEGVSAAYSRIIPYRIVSAGPEGHLKVSINESTEEVTILSSSAGETSRVGYLRVEIPH